MNSQQQRNSNPLISIVLPVYNESDGLTLLYDALVSSIDACDAAFEMVFVNDGSTDSSRELLDNLAASDPRVKALHFSRNFGHQSAVHAGLIHAQGDAVVLMDSDLQDDPNALAKFIEQWRQGYDVVYATRTQRKEKSWKRLLFFSFYRVLNLVSQTRMPMDAGNFGLIDRAVARQIVNMCERDRYFPGLRQWVGFRQTGVPVERGKRYDDQPRVSTLQLFQLAKTAIFSFSRVPLSVFYALALVSIAVCFLCTGFTLYHKWVTGLAVPGWASMTIVASLFGALNSLGIAVLGEYVIRIYDQVRARPPFIIANKVNFADRADRELETEIFSTLSDLNETVGTKSIPLSTTVPLGQGPIQPTESV